MSDRAVVYSADKLRRLWAQGKTHLQIAIALGCSAMHVSRLVKRHGLPRRARKFAPPVIKDPTPREIAAACAAIQAKRKDVKVADRVYVREYQWCNGHFRIV